MSNNSPLSPHPCHSHTKMKACKEDKDNCAWKQMSKEPRCRKRVRAQKVSRKRATSPKRRKSASPKRRKSASPKPKSKYAVDNSKKFANLTKDDPRWPEFQALAKEYKRRLEEELQRQKDKLKRLNKKLVMSDYNLN